ncbi:hypothetical protein EC988_001848 [Linderina pennispora]|nr:hypothetical protein EC988_001848 [Linderina pennispora]
MPDSRKPQFRPTTTWYEDADKYWKSVKSNNDGMLGGLEYVHEPDIRDSTAFLSKLVSQGKLTSGTSYACDCGAGIGRVSKHFLTAQFDKVDLVEQNSVFLKEAEETNLQEAQAQGKIGEFFPLGLQMFEPAHARYDVIWCQWVLSHLTDEDLEAFLVRCKSGLKDGGLICVKENVARTGYIVDDIDSSVTRATGIYEGVFKKAGLKVVAKQAQTGFPLGLFRVNMWALMPI